MVHAHLPKCESVLRDTDEYDPTIEKTSRLAAEFSRSRYFLNKRTGYAFGGSLMPWVLQHLGSNVLI